ncbi:hypothetical protein FEM48_Zijuj02G0060600 [Ziziphus jujuba var. spinosa]|uniref:Integrase zinc-binding domain-containing protein n=1 Tax=Ziziphus jujuba var. spinosa TaxID=714518 RepID=A0A978VU20_ZIZJJ|nr:hypothetical protein FEM48_Zijuj02G0060600 [Ziziphus jujuba var. spinosa]
MLGYQFTTEYKAGSTNSAADALSRRHDIYCLPLLVAISAGRYEFLDELCKENMECSNLKALQKQILAGTLDLAYYSYWNGLLMFKNRFIISKESKLKTLLLQEFHETPTGGHAEIERNFLGLSASFFWEGMRNDVKKFVANCLTCQTIKYSIVAPYGLLQPLEMPERVWEDLAFDFIVGLRNSRGYSTILVVIDRLTKYALGPLPTHYSASKAEYLYNSSHHTAIGMTPFQAVYGRPPTTIPAYVRGSTSVQAVEEGLLTRDSILK